MEYQTNEVGYILEEGIPVPVKIMRRQGDAYLAQRIGSCGALTLHAGEFYRSKEEALENRKPRSIVNVQIGD